MSTLSIFFLSYKIHINPITQVFHCFTIHNIYNTFPFLSPVFSTFILFYMLNSTHGFSHCDRLNSLGYSRSTSKT